MLLCPPLGRAVPRCGAARAVREPRRGRVRTVRSSMQSLPVSRSQRLGSVPCALLLSLQLTDFNKENTVCFLCALKLETCLVPTVPLEEVSMDMPGAGEAPSFARRRLLPCLPPGNREAGCPRRARPCREGDEPREGSEASSFRGVRERGQAATRAEWRWRRCSHSLWGVPGVCGLERGSPAPGTGKCLRAAPSSRPRPHPPGALGGSLLTRSFSARLGRPGGAATVPRLAFRCPPAKRRVSYGWGSLSHATVKAPGTYSLPG